MTVRDLDAVAANEASATPFPWSRGQFADCLAAAYECCVAQRAGAAVGHGVLATDAGEAQLLNVCIVPAAQRRGLGRALARHLLARAAAAGAEAVFLEVRPSNKPARALYASLGFCRIGRRPGYYPAAQGREDALLLTLTPCGPPAEQMPFRRLDSQAGTVRQPR